MKVRFTPVTTIAILPRDKGGELIVNPDIEQRLTEPNVRRRVTQLVDEYSSAMTPLLILPTSLHRHHIMPPRMLNRIDDDSNIIYLPDLRRDFVVSSKGGFLSLDKRSSRGGKTFLSRHDCPNCTTLYIRVLILPAMTATPRQGISLVKIHHGVVES